MSIFRLSACLVVVLYWVIIATPVRIAGWNWMDGNGDTHEYSVFSSYGISWDAAAAKVEDSWHLATITTIGEQNALIAGLQGRVGEFWIGGLQALATTDASDGWSWVTGESWNFTDWAPGEPNDYYGRGSEQHLAVWSRWSTDRWLWNDEGCGSNISGFIAERTQTVPEPEMLPLFAASLFALVSFVRKRRT